MTEYEPDARFSPIFDFHLWAYYDSLGFRTHNYRVDFNIPNWPFRDSFGVFGIDFVVEGGGIWPFGPPLLQRQSTKPFSGVGAEPPRNNEPDRAAPLLRQGFPIHLVSYQDFRALGFI